MLTRDQFRENVFARDNNRCVVPQCAFLAADAHHIISRDLWEGEELGGYYLDNGVSLCSEHHIHAEIGAITPTTLRSWAFIKNVVIPNGWDKNLTYDMKGNGCHGYKETDRFPELKNLLTGLDPILFLHKPLCILAIPDGEIVKIEHRAIGMDGVHAFGVNGELIGAYDDQKKNWMSYAQLSNLPAQRVGKEIAQPIIGWQVFTETWKLLRQLSQITGYTLLVRSVYSFYHKDFDENCAIYEVKK